MHISINYLFHFVNGRTATARRCFLDILSGRDGSIIKSIAFNAKNSQLESILSKKSKKYFNIAGKMNLNEWLGKRSIEFIIEDISIN